MRAAGYRDPITNQPSHHMTGARMTAHPVGARARARAAAFAMVLVFFALPHHAAAQQPGASELAPPAARGADVASIDSIITALYASISGPVGQARDWDRMRSLFIPGGRLIPTGERPDGTGSHRVLTVEDYVAGSGTALTDMGFREVEIGRTTEQFGNIAHTFSAYESYRGTETEPFMRGINSIQLWHDGARWWIVTVYWQQESPRHPIPERYIGG
jgi:hypothetical protein